MATTEQIERVRQQIMRFHELLYIMRIKLEAGERAYANLFSGMPDEEKAGVKEKDLQWKLAEQLVEDVTPLNKAVLQTRFDAHELERAFEELFNIIVTIPAPDEDE